MLSYKLIALAKRFLDHPCECQTELYLTQGQIVACLPCHLRLIWEIVDHAVSKANALPAVPALPKRHCGQKGANGYAFLELLEQPMSVLWRKWTNLSVECSCQTRSAQHHCCMWSCVILNMQLTQGVVSTQAATKHQTSVYVAKKQLRLTRRCACLTRASRIAQKALCTFSGVKTSRFQGPALVLWRPISQIQETS